MRKSTLTRLQRQLRIRPPSFDRRHLALAKLRATSGMLLRSGLLNRAADRLLRRWAYRALRENAKEAIRG